MVAAAQIAVIPGDGIGVDVTRAALQVADAALAALGLPAPERRHIEAGAGYFTRTGHDIEPGGEDAAARADAIFLGAIGLPAVRHADGTEISPHLRLRDIFQLYAGVRPVRAYPNAPQRLADPRAAGIDLVILRESTEGLFYSAAVHGRSQIIGDSEVRDTLRDWAGDLGARLLSIADHTDVTLEQIRVEAERTRPREWLAGHVTSPKRLECVDCGAILHHDSFGPIPACPKCGGKSFRRA